MQAKRGFTLVEILIVVVILGILAAIVIPQFTQASTEAKVSSSLTSLQSLRSQIELYKIQHNDNPPPLGTDGADFEEAMTLCSNTNGETVAVAGRDKVTHPFGPYMQVIPLNPWNNSRSIADADAEGVGWVYDEDTGAIYIAVSDVTDTGALASLEVADAVAPAAGSGT